MTGLLVLYRGDTVGTAKLVAATADPQLVRDFAERLLGEPEEQETDVVLRELENGRRRALRLVRGEANE